MVLLILLVSLAACTEPKEDDTSVGIALQLHFVGANSTQVRISISDTSMAWQYSLNRGDSIISHSLVHCKDTTVTDMGLIPNHDYQYRAYFWEGNKRSDSSDVLNVHTMDTTSYTFTWVLDTFGIYGTEIFDVAILAEDDIRAVGRIWFDDPDSSFNGTGREYFNLAKFNGSEWEFHRVGEAFPGNTYAICVINENDIWYSMAGSPVHWDGTNYTSYFPSYSAVVPEGAPINRIWAKTPDDIYFVGYNSSFIHYDGLAFESIETDTYINLVDIVGTSGSDDIFIRGYKNPGNGDPPGCTILHYNAASGDLQRLYYAEYPNTQGEYGWVLGFGRGSQSNSVYVSTDDGLLEINASTGVRSLIPPEICKFGRSQYNQDGPGQVLNIFYSAPNDIFFVGILMKNIHFNGHSYNLQLDAYEAFPEIRPANSAQLGNMYVVAGYQYNWGYGAIARIWKN